MMSPRVARGLAARVQNGWRVASQPGDPLTPRQLEVWRYIQRHFKRHQKGPTRQQIKDAFSFRSPNAAQDVVMALVAKGALLHQPGKRGGLIPQACTPPEADPESYSLHLPGGEY